MNEIRPLERGPEVAQPTEALSQESIWTKLSRQAYVIGGGLGDSFRENTSLALQHPEKSVPAFLVSAGVGGLLAYAQKRTGLVKIAGELAGLSFSVAFAKDCLNPERIGKVRQALGQTWQSANGLDTNRQLFKESAGQFAFDSAFMMGSGMVGAGAVSFGLSKGVFGGSLESPQSSLIVSKPMSIVSRQRALSLSLGATAESMSGGEKRFPVLEFFPQEKGMPSRQARLLDEAILKQPTPEALEGQRVTWQMADGREQIWNPPSGSLKIRLEAQQFVKQTMEGKYLDAINTALQTDVMRNVDLNPQSRRVDLNVSAQELTNSEHLPRLLDEMSKNAVFKWNQKVADGVIGEESLKVVVPRMLVQTTEGSKPVALVDFARTDKGYKAYFPDTSVTGEPLNAAQLREITSIRNSEVGQRVVAETAIFAFEEALVHANQHQIGEILSPTYAAFARDFSTAFGARQHKLNFSGMLTRNAERRELFFEQEVPALLFDAGMPISMIERHYFFGARHVPERTPFMQYINRLDNGIVPYVAKVH